jgi:hypothetical protein
VKSDDVNVEVNETILLPHQAAGLWHHRGMAVKRELAGRAGQPSEDTGLELWDEAAGSNAVNGEPATPSLTRS